MGLVIVRDGHLLRYGPVNLRAIVQENGRARAIGTLGGVPGDGEIAARELRSSKSRIVRLGADPRGALFSATVESVDAAVGLS
jgi:hypothetical protein